MALTSVPWRRLGVFVRTVAGAIDGGDGRKDTASPPSVEGSCAAPPWPPLRATDPRCSGREKRQLSQIWPRRRRIRPPHAPMPPVKEGEEGAGSDQRGAVRWERGRVRGRERGAVLCAVAGERGSRSGRGGEGVVLGRSHSQERESRLGASLWRVE
ncbi:unnamed protein product [Miscanthus lutarioriparius]|uniref:Uncharacterized protein n=1 Tax=Miscanthus lutarioriparius TaxID=422564 RepID=A0A811PAQ1_9POAL|nr:unnamed protein product [Miscanthus lutarioriparius]